MGALCSTRSRLLEFRTSANPVRVRLHVSESTSDEVTLREFVETYCPSLFKRWNPVWWLRGGHLQTAYSVIGDFSHVDKIVYERKFLRLVDGGTIGLDFTPPFTKELDDATPIVIVLHGLTGGSHESYVRSALNPVTAPTHKGGLGYRAVVVNSRGCAGVPLTSPQLYSAGHTDDLRQAITYISTKYPSAPLLGVGFSLGANVLVRYLAEEGSNSRLLAGCALGCPWDLNQNSDRLEQNWFLKQLYSKGMGGNLTTLFKRHLAAFANSPNSIISKKIAELLTIKSPTLRDFDSRITSIVGGSSPPFPFASAHDYYTWASSHRCLPEVHVPLLCINSADDPIVKYLPELHETDWVALAVTSAGGHLGWFEANDQQKGFRRWVSRPVTEWLRAAIRNYCRNYLAPLQVEVVDGWIRGVHQKHLGYRVLEEQEIVIGTEGEGGLLQGL